MGFFELILLFVCKFSYAVFEGILVCENGFFNYFVIRADDMQGIKEANNERR